MGNSATHVGSLYPADVWDQVIGENRYGYAAATSSEFNGASSDVRNFLQGFQFLYDDDPNNPGGYDYLCDEDYLLNQTGTSEINGQPVQTSDSFICSSNIHDYSVPIAVTPTGNTYIGPSSPDGYYDNNVQCISNGGQGFQGRAWFQATNADGNGNYTWKQATVQASSSPGPINLTQSQADWYMHNSIGPSLSSNSQYPTPYYPSVTWHGQCGVSFPYNIFVSGVQNTMNGSTTTAAWNVTNQTPLYLKGINVRVYTKGLNSGKWTLQAEYDGLDMYPVERNTYYENANPGGLTGKLTGTSTVDPFTVSAAGMWSIMDGSTTFTTPNEPFVTVVTADVNLNIPNGQIGTPAFTTDKMTAEYWSDTLKGLAPPGLPPGDTVDQPGLTTAALNTEYLGVALPGRL